MTRNRRRWCAVKPPGRIAAMLVFTACDRRCEAPHTQRVVELHLPDRIEGNVPAPAASAAVEWRCDGNLPTPAPRATPSTRGWVALRSSHGNTLRAGRIPGRTNFSFPILHHEW